jgi:hypothetical protein
VDLRPRWPLTAEKHGGSTPQVRSSKAASSMARSLTDETRDALATLGSAAAGEAEEATRLAGGGAGAERQWASTKTAAGEAGVGAASCL